MTLDGIRGIAALAVVGFHTHLLFGKGTPPENPLIIVAYDAQLLFAKTISPEAILAVDIFFILSGVVIAKAYESRLQFNLTSRNFTRLRLIRLYPLYILGTSIGILEMMLRLNLDSDIYYVSLSIVLAVLILPNPFTYEVFPFNLPAWSLFYEITINIVYAVAFRFLTRRLLATIMAVSALGLAGILYFDCGPDHNLAVGWTAKNFLGGFFRVGYSFFAGVLLYRLSPSIKAFPCHNGLIAIMPWAILGLIGVILSARTTPAFRPYYEFAVVVLLFPAIVYSALWFEPSGVGAKLCKFLGSVSYSIYAIHMPLFWLIRGMSVRVTGVPVENWAPWGGFGLIIVLLPFCWALDKFYDRPLRNLLLARSASKFAAVPIKS